MTASATRVLWARHGQNGANVTLQFSYRRLDLNLTELGREQGEQLAARLADRVAQQSGPAFELFASPLRRAQQTAEIVGRRLGVEAQTLDDLRELNVGLLDGRSDPQAWVTYEAVLDAWRRGEYDTRFPDGEDWYELCARLRAALQRVTDAAAAGTAVIVAHGANLRAALPGLTTEHDPGVDLGTGQVAELQVTNTASGTMARLLHWDGTSTG